MRHRDVETVEAALAQVFERLTQSSGVNLASGVFAIDTCGGESCPKDCWRPRV
jgi:hypothetical protein